MKQKKLKHLSLNKETVANLNVFDLSKAIGGVGPTITMECCQKVIAERIEIPGIDIPTFNDSCFSLCDDKCNDW